MKRLFLNTDGRLRHFWRTVAFFVLSAVAAPFLLKCALLPVQEALHAGDGLSAETVAFGESVNLLIALICTIPFALYEHRGLLSYGFPVRSMLGPRLWEGFIVGAVMAALIAIGMIALGGMQIKGFALNGAALLHAGLAWLGANVLVGLGEEYYFRGYFLQSLWRSIGFWPAALVIAAIFAAAHYFLKPGENIWDVITLVTLSLWLCYTVLRTGNLWFAAGFHAAYDFMQFFVIGTPNGERIPQGRMLNVTFNGPAWLTGGVLGTEASFLMYPLILAIWVYVWWRFRGRPDFVPAAP
ncbi:MAG: CPBP family intramembrane metalloprotease [Proteobacteria bacterium]|nr:CPBP family intramembrane metalloprotease [Pseudomonadota bacterium]